MQTLYPDYYAQFRCTADKCPITCCQEWKISVDDDTLKRWAALNPPVDSKLFTYVQDGQRVIALNSRHVCPFLEKNKLCRLVLEHGENAISETCQIFPRETHSFADHEEASLMPCCPAVIDLWAAQDAAPLTFPRPDIDSIPFFIRSAVIDAILQQTDRLPEQILSACFYMIQEIHRKKKPTKDFVSDCFSEKSFCQLYDAMDDLSPDCIDSVLECNELLLDLSVNYQKEQLYQEWLTPLTQQAKTLSELLTEPEDETSDPSKPYEEIASRAGIALSNLLAHLQTEEELPAQWQAFRTAFAQYEPLMRSYLANEVYSELLSFEDTTRHMLVRLQWLMLQYAALRQSLFLIWQDSPEAFSYEKVREALVIINRMTGYDEEDIYEYLENSFESLLWDWGYFALLAGF